MKELLPKSWRHREAQHLDYSSDEEAGAFPKLLLQSYERWGDTRAAMRRKELGIWRLYTWKDCYDEVKYFCLGLMALGFRRRDKMTIVGDSNPEWFWFELAAQAAGGVVTGTFASCLVSELKYVVQHSDSSFVVVQDQEQVDKILEIANELPRVKKVIYWNPKGMQHYDHSLLVSSSRVLELGQELGRNNPGLFEDSIAQGKADDVGLLLYTAGTEGQPKGVMLSYRGLISSTAAIVSRSPYWHTSDYFSFALPFWSVEQSLGLVAGLMTGQTIDFPEKQETTLENITELSPNTLLYPSTLWEGTASTIQSKVGDSSLLRRLIYGLCLSVGYRVGDLKAQGKVPQPFWRILFSLVRMTVFRALRSRHGLHRCSSAYTSGSLLGSNTIRFFRALGLNVKQVYGSSEAGLVAADTDEDMKPGAVGKPLPGVVLRLSEDGEILLIGKGFHGYYQEPEASKGVLEGTWLHTGDVGHLDDDGYLVFLDRMRNTRRFANGTTFFPQQIEAQLRFSPYIQEAFVFAGGEENSVGAIISIDFENVSKWAAKRGIRYRILAELSQNPEVYQLIQGEIEKANQFLPEKIKVKRFVNLHKPLCAADGELTRSMKLRRAFVEDRYKELMEAVHGEKEEQLLGIPVVPQDGSEEVTNIGIRLQRLD